MTPLIDIMLVLLIIFMIAMPRMVNEMAMNLPSKTESKKKEDDDIIDADFEVKDETGEEADKAEASEEAKD